MTTNRVFIPEDLPWIESLSCPICFELPKNPIEIIACGHYFCEGCLAGIAAAARAAVCYRCPICRGEVRISSPDQPATRPARLPAYLCSVVPGRCGECQWQGTREGFERDHLTLAECPPPPLLPSLPEGTAAQEDTAAVHAVDDSDDDSVVSFDRVEPSSTLRSSALRSVPRPTITERRTATVESNSSVGALVVTNRRPARLPIFHQRKNFYGSLLLETGNVALMIGYAQFQVLYFSAASIHLLLCSALRQHELAIRDNMRFIPRLPLLLE